MKNKTDFFIKKLEEVKATRREHETLVKDIMSSDVITINVDDVVILAAEKILKHRIHSLIVTDNEKPVGIIASYDLLLVMSISDYFDKNTKIKDVMVKDIITIQPEDTIKTAIKKMIEYNIRLLAVVKEEKLLGVVSLIDLVLGLVDLSNLTLDKD